MDISRAIKSFINTVRRVIVLRLLGDNLLLDKCDTPEGTKWQLVDGKRLLLYGWIKTEPYRKDFFKIVRCKEASPIKKNKCGDHRIDAQIYPARPGFEQYIKIGHFNYGELFKAMDFIEKLQKDENGIYLGSYISAGSDPCESSMTVESLDIDKLIPETTNGSNLSFKGTAHQNK